MISVNDIYESLEGGNEFRVLWVSPENDLVYVIYLQKTKLPVPINSHSDRMKSLFNVNGSSSSA